MVYRTMPYIFLDYIVHLVSSAAFHPRPIRLFPDHWQLSITCLRSGSFTFTFQLDLSSYILETFHLFWTTFPRYRPTYSSSVYIFLETRRKRLNWFLFSIDPFRNELRNEKPVQGGKRIISSKTKRRGKQRRLPSLIEHPEMSTPL